MTRRIATALLPALLRVIAAGSACGGGPAEGAAHASDAIERPLLFHHGLEVGDLVSPYEMRCSDGVTRILGAPSSLQLVTFSTTGDCSTCDRHMNGLEQLYRDRSLRGEQFVVTYAPHSRQTEVLSTLQAWTTRPICFDEQGLLWTKYDISHTPVTALLSSGRVRYLDDAPVETERDLLMFAQAVISRASSVRR